jgi:hypothetical protein
MNQTGSTSPPYIENIYIHGEIEQQSGCTCGTAIKVTNSGPPNDVAYINIDVVNMDTGFWAAQNNFSASNTLAWRIRNLYQGVILQPTAAPGATRQFPYEGVAWDVSGASFEAIPLGDGTFHFIQTYPSVSDFLTIDANSANLRLMPTTGSTGNLGIASQPWAKSAINLMTSPGVAFASLPAAAAGAMEWCTDCQVTTAGSCSTATPASCVCKAGGNGSWAKGENFQGNGLNWYCQ